MAFGFIGKNESGLTQFSDEVPSMVFMGKAALSNYSAQKLYNVGFMTSDGPASGGSFEKKYGFRPGSTGIYIGGGLTFPDNIVRETSGGAVVLDDDASVMEFEVFSFEKPIIYISFLDPVSYGAHVLKITDSGSTDTDTGSPTYGYKKWTIDVLVFHPLLTEGTAIAASNIELLCFSKIDPSVTAGTGYGMHILDDSNNTMFHSDWQPLAIQGDISYGTRSGTIVVSDNSVFSALQVVYQLGTINNAIITSSGIDGDGVTLHVENAQGDFTNGETLVNGLGLTISSAITSSSISEGLDSTDLKTYVSTSFGSLTRPAALWKDFARIRTFSVNSESHGFYQSFDSSGIPISTSVGVFKMDNVDNSLGSHLGTSSAFFPVIDALDYDNFTDITTSVSSTSATVDTSVPGYTYYIFTGTTGNFTVTTQGEDATTGTIKMDILVVAGGGGGSGSHKGAGGGAGGLITGEIDMPKAGSYDIVIGTGGAGAIGFSGNGANGTDSTFLGMTAIGGGADASPGGSGSGGADTFSRVGYGYEGQGFNGGLGASGNAGGGGGGGASEVGFDGVGSQGGAGGDGKRITFITTAIADTYNIGEADGTDSNYFAGGGGGTYKSTETGTGGAGGLGGGGQGSDNPTDDGDDALANSGGGGGGALQSGRDSGDGGSGVVVIRLHYQ